MNKVSLKLAAVAVGLAASVVASQAAVDINGTLGIIPFGNVTFTGPSLGSALTLTIPSAEQVNTTPTPYNATENVFAQFVGAPYGEVAVGAPVTIAPLTLNAPFGGPIAQFITIPFASGLNSYVFDLTTLTVTSSDPNHLSLQGEGVLSTLLAGNFNPTPTLFSASFNTTGVGAANGSFTLSTVVPEPATYIAGLGALCLFGFTALPKRRK